MFERRDQLLVLFAAVGTFVAFAGCKAQPCTSSNPNLPSPALDCPAGDLCYLGECVRSCSAGQERAAECSSDGDCEAARPNCIAGFCSSCDDEQTCVPTLNICAPIDTVIYPEPPPDNMFMTVNKYPLDGGAQVTNGAVAQFNGLQRLVDAGQVGPIMPTEVTVAGIFDIGEIIDFRGGNPTPPQTTTVSVSVYDVSGVAAGLKWRPELSPPRIEQTFIDDIFTLDTCSVRDVTTSTALPNPSQVDLGAITVDEFFDDKDAIRGELRAQWSTDVSRYVIQRVDITSGTILNFSIAVPSVESNWLNLAGTGNNAYTTGPWPARTGGFDGFHVPFELKPTTATRSLIESTIVVPIGGAQDLSFAWIDFIATGNFDGESVRVRVLGRRAEIFCFDLEGNAGDGRIDVAAGVLNEFMVREGNTPATYTLVFERASNQGVFIPPVEGQAIRFSLQTRHSLLTNIRFQ